MYLRRRVQIVFVALALLVAADMVLDRILAAERDELRRDMRRRWEPALAATAELQVALVDQETGERGFLITGERQFLEPYTSGGERVDAALAVLQRLVGGDAGIEPQLQRARDRISAWRQLGATFEIEAKLAEREQDVRSLVATGTSKMLFDEARLEITELQRTIVARLARQERMVDQLEERISALRAVTALMALAIVVAASVLLRRWLTRPLTQLAQAARTIASGNLDHRIPAPGPPELADLGRDVEAMRRRILYEVDHAARAESSLAQRGMIVLTLRDELAPSTIELPSAVRVATRFSPAETFVAGDWYDIRRPAEDRVVFVLADVSGHGPAAAVFALKTKQLACIALNQGLSPSKVWAWVAEQLGDTGDQFLTGVIGSLDVRAGVLSYASAGHPHLLLRTDSVVRTLGPTGPLVGLVPGAWDEVTVRTPPGSCLVAYTDGLLEVQDGAGRWADLAGLIAMLDGAEANDVEAIADVCVAFRRGFDGRERPDDVTVVVVGLEG